MLKEVIRVNFNIQADNVYIRQLLYFIGKNLQEISIVEGDVTKANIIGSSIVLNYESGKKYKVSFTSDMIQVVEDLKNTGGKQ